MANKSRGRFAGQQALLDRVYHPQAEWNPIPQEALQRTIPQHFAAIVEQYPDRVVAGDRQHTFTYRQLDSLSNQCAWQIIELLRMDSEPIAILLPRNGLALAGIHGILKSGKAYVFLDPTYPQSQLEYILHDTGSRLILTTHAYQPLAEQLAQSAIGLLYLDALSMTETSAAPEVAIKSDCIANITYTSGSTGRPKGVFHDHAYLMYYLIHFLNDYHVSPLDRFSETGGLIVSLAASLAGASVWPLDVKQEGFDALDAWLVEKRVTIFVSVTSLFRRFIQSRPETSHFLDLRLINLGGEALYAADVSAISPFVDEACFVDHSFGLSEAGTIAHFLFEPHAVGFESQLPAGYAIEGKEIMILDEAGQLVGPNVVGEIAIRSAYLAGGYWNLPDLTNASFHTDPHNPRKQIYLTGDLGRLEEDGCLWHEGRSDFQVKISGYRVETAAIEATLLNMKAIRQAAVVAKKGIDESSLYLAAYLVTDQRPPPSISAIRAFLADHLPDYMIPTRYVFLDVLPSTPIGKINRRLLPDPPNKRPALDTAYRPPLTSVESQIAAIWSRVIGLDGLGLDDNFFELDGQSLQIMQIASQIKDIFGFDIPLSKLFDVPTIAQTAELVVRYQNGVEPESAAD